MDLLPAALKPYVAFMTSALIAIGILVFGWIASKWGNRLTRRAFAAKKIDAALANFVSAIVQYALLAATVITALGAVGIQTTSFVAIFASAGLAVGLALQGSLTNFASGVLILFFRPFDLGHRITAGGQSGTVHDIGIFATTLHTADNETIIVPNSAITGGSIINHTKQGTLRGQVAVAVAYGSDIGKVLTVLESAAKRTELAMKEPSPAVACANFGARGFELSVYAWSKPEDMAAMLHNLRKAIYEDLKENGVEGPPVAALV